MAAFGNQRDVTLCSLTGWAGITTGSATGLIDGIGCWDGLSVQAVGRFAILQTGFIEVGQGNRAHLGAVAAADAFIDIYVAWPMADMHREVPGPAINAEHIGIGVDLDIEMAAGVDQFGAYIAHGAIISRECLIQLGHVSADGCLLLDQMDLKTLIGQIQSRLDAGNATANHHHGTSRCR
jgi:hypothetical protein